MKIRKAIPSDAKPIHEAHMRSIRELCAKDYNKAQILAWGGRKYNEESRQKSIRDNHIWVVEVDKKIHGYCHLMINTKDNYGEIVALYVTPEVVGKGFGKKMLQLAEQEAKRQKLDKMKLNSTLTSKEFYISQGYAISDSQFCVKINNVDVDCIPMVKIMKD